MFDEIKFYSRRTWLIVSLAVCIFVSAVILFVGHWAGLASVFSLAFSLLVVGVGFSIRKDLRDFSRS